VKRLTASKSIFYITKLNLNKMPTQHSHG